MRCGGQEGDQGEREDYGVMPGIRLRGEHTEHATGWSLEVHCSTIRGKSGGEKRKKDEGKTTV